MAGADGLGLGVLPSSAERRVHRLEHGVATGPAEARRHGDDGRGELGQGRLEVRGAAHDGPAQGTLPRRLALDGKFVKDVMGVVSMVDCETGAPVAVASSRRKEGTIGECEFPKGQKLIRDQDLTNALVCADALHGQQETARALAIGNNLRRDIPRLDPFARIVLRPSQVLWRTRRSARQTRSMAAVRQAQQATSPGRSRQVALGETPDSPGRRASPAG